MILSEHEFRDAKGRSSAPGYLDGLPEVAVAIARSREG